MLTRIAIVGSGPSGLYTAKYLLDGHPSLRIDFFEKLCTPFGLVRYGIAPDHQDAKNVATTLTPVLASERVRFFGNVEFGTSVHLEFLQKRYSAIVFASGSSSERRLGIPGDSSTAVVTSRDFVSWYNGHPQYTQPAFTSILKRAKRVAIIGHGNVSLDCARMLVKSRELLALTDISTTALDILREVQLDKVFIIGRRGPVQSSFTIKELKELSRLNNIQVTVSKTELTMGLNSSSMEELESSRPKKKIIDYLDSLSSATSTADNSTDVDIRFLWQPIEIVKDKNDSVKGISLGRTQLQGSPFRQIAVGTGKKQIFPCDLVITSLGYLNSPLEKLPFDRAQLVVPNHKGKVTADLHTGLTGVYVSGWLKRGAQGTIATSVSDAKETANTILADISQLPLKDDVTDFCFDKLVSWDGYRKIDSEEVLAGKLALPHKPRVKIESQAKLIEIGTVVNNSSV